MSAEPSGTADHATGTVAVALTTPSVPMTLSGMGAAGLGDVQNQILASSHTDETSVGAGSSSAKRNQDFASNSGLISAMANV